MNFDERIFRKALLQIAGERLRSRRISRKTQGKGGGVFDVPAVRTLQRRHRVLFPFASIPAHGFPHRSCGLVNRRRLAFSLLQGEIHGAVGQPPGGLQAAGTSQSESLRVGHPVFRPALAPGQSDCPVHLLLVSLQHRDVVSDDEKTGEFQLALGRRLNRPLGFLEATGEEIAPRKIAIPHPNVGINRDFFARCFDRSFVSAGPMGGNAPKQTMGIGSFPAGIRLKPQLEGLVGLFQVSRHLTVVGKVDEEPFAIAHAVPEEPGFHGALGRQH